MHWDGTEEPCLPRFLHVPMAGHLQGKTIYKAAHATLECGKLSQGDKVFLDSGNVGTIDSFFEIDNHMFCCLRMHTHIEGIYFSLHGAEEICHVDSIVEGIFWYASPKGYIVAAVPKYL